jgi:hypothetical protein
LVAEIYLRCFPLRFSNPRVTRSVF